MFDRINKGMWWDRALTLVEGCTPVSPGCDNCWSAAMSYRFKPEQFASRNGFNRPIVCRQDRLDLPLKVKKPTAWAVWNDLFHEDVPGDFINAFFLMSEDCERHIFIVLTKRPERLLSMPAYLNRPWPENIWLGVTAENQEQADKRIPILLQIPAAVRLVSVEPMLGPVVENINKLDWVICGCESGLRRRQTEWNWIESLKDQCKAAGVPFFLKQGELGGKVVKAPYPEHLGLPSHD